MIDLASTDEQRLLAQNLRRYLGEANEFEKRRRRLSAASPDRLALWPELADMGLIGAAIDEAHGGFAGDARTLATVMFELGRALAVEPYLGCAVMAGRILQALADEDERARNIESLIAGKTRPILAHEAGDDPFGPPLLTARESQEGFTLSGRLRCVRHADIASEILLTATLQGEPVIFRIDRNALSNRLRSFRLMDASSAADIDLNDFSLPASARLQLQSPAAQLIGTALSAGLLGLAAEALGIVEALNAATFSYLGTRKQFGTVLANFQALQHRAADMHIGCEELHAMIELGIDSSSTATGTRKASSMAAAAKITADRVGRLVSHEAIQMHGGMGVSDEFDVSHYARRLASIRAEITSADSLRLHYGSLQ